MFVFFRSVFYRIWTEYGEQMLEKTDQETPNMDNFQAVSASILSVISNYLEEQFTIRLIITKKIYLKF